MFIIANSEKSISKALGPGNSGPSGGSSRLALSTASFTLRSASSKSTSVLNSTKIIDASCAETEVISFKPRTFSSSFSKGLVIRFSISSGEFPG